MITMAETTETEHSALGQATLFLALLVVGTMWTFSASGVWSVPEQVVWATALGILGTGLLVGAFIGRARWLIWICIPVIFLLASTSAPSRTFVWPRSADVGDRDWRPLTATEASQDFALGVGTGVLDLTEIQLPDDPLAVVPVEARVDMGTLMVRVPESVRTVVDARAGMGTVDVEGASQRDGMNPQILVTFPGRSQGPTLDLKLSVGMGTVEVSRAETFS